jgi:hypothetical protein
MFPYLWAETCRQWYFHHGGMDTAHSVGNTVIHISARTL